MKIKVKGVKIVIYKIDLILIRNYHWYLHRKNYLCCSNGKYRGKLLHRVIAERMGLNINKQIYHKNNNHFDFRHSNLIDFSPLQESIRENILIDEWNMDLIEEHNWSLNSGGYFQTRIDSKIQQLHRIVAERMGLDPSKEVDHIDGNRENNHESNLREATPSQNQHNCKKQKNNTSGYKGVTWRKDIKKWQAQICFEYKQIHLGYFDDKVDAARTYDRAAIKYFGEFAHLNFSRKDYE